MDLLMTAAESVWLIIGSLGAAFLLCFLCWRMTDAIAHPEISGFLVAVAAIAALATLTSNSPLFSLAMLFALAGAVPLWIAGRERRADRHKTHSHGNHAGTPSL